MAKTMNQILKEVIAEYLEKSRAEHFNAVRYWKEYSEHFKNVSHAMETLIKCRDQAVLAMEQANGKPVVTRSDVVQIEEALKRADKAWEAFKIEWALHGIPAQPQD